MTTTKTVLITGAARGLGQSMAVAFAKAGYAVGINYLQNESGAKATEILIRELGGKSLLIKADVSRSTDVKEMFSKIKQEWGRLDVLVNNAGVVRNRTVGRMTDEEWRDVMSVSLDGTFFCSREALSLMRAQKSGAARCGIQFARTERVKKSEKQEKRGRGRGDFDAPVFDDPKIYSPKKLHH